MKLRRMEDGSKSPCILKAEVCAIQIRTCCGNPEDPSHIRCLNADRLSASVGHEASTWAHDPPVLTVRYAEQVQGLDQGQAVRHLQGQGLCNRSSPSLIWNVLYGGSVLLRSASYRNRTRTENVEHKISQHQSVCEGPSLLPAHHNVCLSLPAFRQFVNGDTRRRQKSCVGFVRESENNANTLAREMRCKRLK